MKATAKNLVKVLETINSIKNKNMFSTDKIVEKYGEDVWEVLYELENKELIEFTEDIDAEFDGIIKFSVKIIKYGVFLRCTKKDMTDYYRLKFAKFKTDDITVSEKSPMSPDNGGYTARQYWRRADEDEARRTNNYPVWFKNSSWYGGSQYYIKDRHEGGRNTPKPTIIVGVGCGTECK